MRNPTEDAQVKAIEEAHKALKAIVAECAAVSTRKATYRQLRGAAFRIMTTIMPVYGRLAGADKPPAFSDRRGERTIEHVKAMLDHHGHKALRHCEDAMAMRDARRMNRRRPQAPVAYPTTDRRASHGRRAED